MSTNWSSMSLLSHCFCRRVVRPALWERQQHWPPLVPGSPLQQATLGGNMCRKQNNVTTHVTCVGPLPSPAIPLWRTTSAVFARRTITRRWTGTCYFQSTKRTRRLRRSWHRRRRCQRLGQSTWSVGIRNPCGTRGHRSPFSNDVSEVKQAHIRAGYTWCQWTKNKLDNDVHGPRWTL